MTKHNLWKREEDLDNAKEVVAKFERRMNAEIRQQERLDIVDEKDMRREKLSGKFIAKILYRWDNRKFKDKYLRKLEKNWQKWKSVSVEKKP